MLWNFLNDARQVKVMVLEDILEEFQVVGEALVIHKMIPHSSREAHRLGIQCDCGNQRRESYREIESNIEKPTKDNFNENFENPENIDNHAETTEMLNLKTYQDTEEMDIQTSPGKKSPLKKRNIDIHI